MNKKDLIYFNAFVLDSIRKWFKKKNIVESRYNQFSFAGSCENAPTTFWVDKEDKFYMLPQTRQIMMEADLINNDLDATYLIQSSYRDEPKAGDSRHCLIFSLCEMEHRDMTQDELIKFEIDMLKFMIERALEYFKEHPNIVTKQNIARLKYTVEVDIPIVTYDEMIEELHKKGVSINWGDDFSSRDEEFICGMHVDIPIPVVVTNYPEKLKYFNMYLKRDTEGTDREVVECADLLLPFAGETWGSSRRENEGKRIRDRFYKGTMYRDLYERLYNKIEQSNPEWDEQSIKNEIDTVVTEAFEPYFQLFDDKKYDRSGYGMGIGRLCQFLLGQTKIVEI